jgi:hypothetical protein
MTLLMLMMLTAGREVSCDRAAPRATEYANRSCSSHVLSAVPRNPVALDKMTVSSRVGILMLCQCILWFGIPLVAGCAARNSPMAEPLACPRNVVVDKMPSV